MKTFVNIVLLGAMLFASQLSVADSGLSEDVPITVTVAAKVQEQINKLTPLEKNRVEEVIKVGASFMQQYLDGLVCDTENQFWDEEVGRVVAKDSYEWGVTFCSQENAVGKKRNRPQACSQTSLIALKLENGDAILRYRTIQLGTLNYDSSGPNEFNSQGAGNIEQLIIMVNSDNRVYDIAPKGEPDEIAYGRFISEAKFFLKFPHGGGMDTPETLKARGIRYKILIKQMEQHASHVCK